MLLFFSQLRIIITSWKDETRSDARNTTPGTQDGSGTDAIVPTPASPGLASIHVAGQSPAASSRCLSLWGLLRHS